MEFLRSLQNLLNEIFNRFFAAIMSWFFFVFPVLPPKVKSSTPKATPPFVNYTSNPSVNNVDKQLNPQEAKDKPNYGLIFGLVFGLLVVILVAFCVIVIVKKKRSPRLT